MLSDLYTFKSNELKYGYINGSINYKTYLSSLEDIKREELASVIFDFNHRLIEEEISAFETEQMKEANQEISNQRKNAEILQLKIEREKTKRLEEEIRIKREDKKMEPKSLEEKLIQARTQFYEKEAPDIIDSYKEDSKKYRNRHDRLQMMIITFSALSTSATGATIFTGLTSISITLKILAAFFSLAVTIASGSIAYFKYKERSNDIQKTADTIEDDFNALKLGTGNYRGKSFEESLSAFAENTNNIISEHKKKQQLLDQPPDTKPGQAT